MQHTNKLNTKQKQFVLFFFFFPFHTCGLELPAAAVEKAKTCSEQDTGQTVQ